MKRQRVSHDADKDRRSIQQERAELFRLYPPEDVQQEGVYRVENIKGLDVKESLIKAVNEASSFNTWEFYRNKYIEFYQKFRKDDE